MNKRIFQMLNFFAFNLLFFALYLNFVHKDNNTLPPVPASQPTATVGKPMKENEHTNVKAKDVHHNAKADKASFN